MIVNFIACCGCYEKKHRNDLSNRKARVTPLTISEYDDNDDGYFSHPNTRLLKNTKNRNGK
jgi:hypothetical protein